MAGSTNFPGTNIDSFGDVTDAVDDVDDNHINDLRRAVEAIETKLGIDSSAVTASIDYKVNNFFVSNRRIYLYENTAPTGWSIHSPADCVLAVKGGSNAYNVSGGNLAGSFVITTSQMPSHTHTYYLISGAVWAGQASPGGIRPVLGAGYYGDWNITTASTGSGDGTFRPYAAVGIIINKT